ncbi:MAG TPA: hypothetical protein VE862_07585 [Candidatus Acidoferrum sp.]|nr:hypothetical protein [Candidatus Acidoferrum sp.]
MGAVNVKDVVKKPEQDDPPSVHELVVLAKQTEVGCPAGLEQEPVMAVAGNGLAPCGPSAISINKL